MFGKIQLKHIFPGHENEWYQEVHRVGVVKSYAENQVIVKPGEGIDHAMLVVDGLLKVYQCAGDGAEYFMYFLEPGQACAFSLRACAEQKNRQLMIRTASDSLVMLIPIRKAQEWMRQFESWNQFVNAIYHKRLDDLLGAIDHIAFQQMEDRILSYLENQAAITGNEIKLTHSEIAKDLNSSREVISRLLKKLEAKGKIAMHRNALNWLASDPSLLKG